MKTILEFIVESQKTYLYVRKDGNRHTDMTRERRLIETSRVAMAA